MKKTYLKLLLILTLFSCASHDKHNKLYYQEIAPKKLKEDVKFVQKQIRKMHPDLYWYISEQALNYKFDSLQQTITTPLTANEFYLKISPLVASVHQGHMRVSMITLTAADSLKKKYKGSTNPLEHFEYAYVNDKLYITKNKSEKDSLIQIGSEVTAINAIKPQTLFEKYEKTFTSDGYNKTGIPKFFAKRLNGLYAAELGFIDSISIDLICDNIASTQIVKRKFEEPRLKNKNKQAIDKKQPQNTENQLTKLEQKKKNKAQLKKSKLDFKHKSLFGYDYKTKEYEKAISYPNTDNKTTALLKIKGFSNSKIKVYDSIFAELKANNVKNLIIDLRGNPGGRLQDIYKLSQFLNDSTYKFMQPAVITNRFAFFNAIKGKSVVGTVLSFPFVTIFSTIRALKTQKNDKGEVLYFYASSKLTEPKSINYKNNLYVLTNGMTFSAASLISSHLKGRNRAIFVGEETGGTFNGTVAGIMPEIKLPHSKLKMRIGLMSIKPVEQTLEKGYGIKPNIEITPTINQLINKEDPELEWILNDINQKNKSQ